MRKWIIVFASVGILSFLILRLFNNHVDGVRNERQWYIEQLNFEFSAVIDSVRRRHILLHLKEEDIDWHQESRVKKKLKYNGVLDLFLYRANHRIELKIDSANLYLKGDSIYLNSNKNLIRIYRANKLISEYELSESLKGRPF